MNLEQDWLRYVNNGQAPVDMDGIAGTLLSVAACLREAGPVGLDFSQVNRTNPSPQHLVALLRTTYSVRHDVRGWQDLRDFTRAYLPTVGCDHESVMKGLVGAK